MFDIDNLGPDDLVTEETFGPFTICTYLRDISNYSRESAMLEYFAAKMNVCKKQVICDLSQAPHGVTLQNGAMQWMVGDVSVKTNATGIGNLIKKVASASATKETAINPVYFGDGVVALEPTYNHIIPIKPEWFNGSVNIADSTFLACENTIERHVRTLGVSAGMLGGQGFFVNNLAGEGTALLESPVPMSELVTITLDNDVLKVDGNLVLAWSDTIEFTVKRTTSTLVGSAASGEGLVNVYRGTGTIYMMPVL